MTKLKTILIAGTAAVALGTAPAMAGLLGGDASGGGSADVGVGTSGLHAGAETSADAGMKTPGVNGSVSGETETRGNVVTPNASSAADTATDAAAGATSKMENKAEAGAEMGADAANSAVSGAANLEAQLKERGYSEIERTDDMAKTNADGEAHFTATNQDGENVKLTVNTRTGAVVDEQPES